MRPTVAGFFHASSAEGNVLVCVELFDGDGDGAVAAILLVDVGDVGCFALGSFAADAGFGVGFDSAVALWAAESDVAVLVGFADGFPGVFGAFGVPVGAFFAGEVRGWDQEVVGCPLHEEGAAVEQQALVLRLRVLSSTVSTHFLVVFFVVHDHVDAEAVEGSHEGFSVEGVSHVGDDFFEVGEGFLRADDGGV